MQKQAIGGIYELKNAVTSIANDVIGELPDLLVASRNTLYLIKKKTSNFLKNILKSNQIDKK